MQPIEKRPLDKGNVAVIVDDSIEHSVILRGLPRFSLRAAAMRYVENPGTYWTEYPHKIVMPERWLDTVVSRVAQVDCEGSAFSEAREVVNTRLDEYRSGAVPANI